MNLDSTFGMVEMEEAAAFLVEEFNESGTRYIYLPEVMRKIADTADSWSLLVGLSELLAHGWLESTCDGGPINLFARAKGEWYVSEKFLERVKFEHPEAITRDW